MGIPGTVAENDTPDPEKELSKNSQKITGICCNLLFINIMEHHEKRNCTPG
jgi:hypothetical protein